MKTIIDKIIEPFTTLENMRECAKRVEVLETGLFGIYHYKVKDLEFKQKTLFPWRRFSPHVWIMIKNGKEYKVKYSYVLYLTFKRLGII